MGLNKIYTYPLVIVFILGVASFLFIKIVHNIGLKVNPSLGEVKINDRVESYVIYEHGEVWRIDLKSKFSIFQPNRIKTKEGQILAQRLRVKNPEYLFLVIKTNVGKESALRLLKVLAKFKLKQVYVASPFDNTLSNLKRVEPRFLYAPSPKAWVKWSLFTSFYMETIYKLRSDFLFIDDKVKEILSPKLKAEIKRRNLLIITTVNVDQGVVF